MAIAMSTFGHANALFAVHVFKSALKLSNPPVDIHLSGTMNPKSTTKVNSVSSGSPLAALAVREGCRET